MSNSPPVSSTLRFTLHDRCYGIDAHAVREVFFLPTIQTIATRASFRTHASMIGMINLRGTLLSVMDLSHYLGYGPHPYAISDSIIVLGDGDRQIGVVVSHVMDVALLDNHDSLLNDNHPMATATANEHPIVGVTQHHEDMVIRLNPEVLVNSLHHGFSGGLAPTEKPLIHEGGESLTEFFPDATVAERQRLRERANNLRQQMMADDQKGDRVSVAVLQIHGERVALPVEYIREFTAVRAVTPIPCCPPHILGNMNLRGEILTLIDIHQVLNLRENTSAASAKAVVVQCDEIIAGITIDAVFDVISFEPSTLSPIPVGAHTGHEDYLRGVISYQKSPVSVLNIAHLLKSDELIVNAEEKVL